MPPLLAAAIGSLIRAGLMVLAGYLVQKGLWTQDAANEYVAAAVLGLLGLGWSLWQKYKSNLTFLTALSLPAGSTPADVKAMQKDTGMGKVAPLILLLVAVPALTLTGCAWFQKAPTVDATQLAYQQVKKAADVVNAAGQVVASAQQMEISLYQTGNVPRPAHLTIQQGFKTLAEQVQSGLVVLRDLTKTPMERQAAITQIGTSMSGFITKLPALADDVKAKIVALMNGAVLMIQGALLLT